MKEKIKDILFSIWVIILTFIAVYCIIIWENKIENQNNTPILEPSTFYEEAEE